MNRLHFTPPFFPSALPPWRCPQCIDGALVLVKDSLKIEETSESKKDRKNPDWDPEWIRQRFSVLLRCGQCQEPVFAVGAVRLMDDHDDEHGWVLGEALAPTFFEPAPPIICVPSACPKEVTTGISGACALFWSSPSSAANRIRSAVERLMDHRGIARKVKTKKGKLEDLSLHARIEGFANKNPDVGNTLLAIKWLGNTGSHASDLKASDVLDAFELLLHALEEIYESKTARLKKMASTIIKTKGHPAK